MTPENIISQSVESGQLVSALIEELVPVLDAATGCLTPEGIEGMASSLLADGHIAYYADLVVAGAQEAGTDMDGRIASLIVREAMAKAIVRVIDKRRAFEQAKARYMEAAETLGEDSEEARDAWLIMFEHAPQALNDLCYAEVDRLGMLPAPSGVTTDGERVYALEDVAEKLGISIEDAQRGVEKMQDRMQEAGIDTADKLIDSGAVHALH